MQVPPRTVINSKPGGESRETAESDSRKQQIEMRGGAAFPKAAGNGVNLMRTERTTENSEKRWFWISRRAPEVEDAERERWFWISRRAPEVEDGEREIIEECMHRRMEQARETVLKSVAAASDNSDNHMQKSESSNHESSNHESSNHESSNHETGNHKLSKTNLQYWLQKAAALAKAIADRHLELSLARPFCVLLTVHLCNVLLMFVLMYSVDRIMTETGELGDYAPRMLRIVRDA